MCDWMIQNTVVRDYSQFSYESSLTMGFISLNIICIEQADDLTFSSFLWFIEIYIQLKLHQLVGGQVCNVDVQYK